jgi:hypothetical protein
VFPRSSAFDPSNEPTVRELFRKTEGTIQAQEANTLTTVTHRELEDWYHRLDELVRNFDVPYEHVVSGSRVAAGSEELERLRDEVYQHLR